MSLLAALACDGSCSLRDVRLLLLLVMALPIDSCEDPQAISFFATWAALAEPDEEQPITERPTTEQADLAEQPITDQPIMERPTTEQHGAAITERPSRSGRSRSPSQTNTSRTPGSPSWTPGTLSFRQLSGWSSSPSPERTKGVTIPTSSVVDVVPPPNPTVSTSNVVDFVDLTSPSPERMPPPKSVISHSVDLSSAPTTAIESTSQKRSRSSQWDPRKQILELRALREQRDRDREQREQQAHATSTSARGSARPLRRPRRGKSCTCYCADFNGSHDLEVTGERLVAWVPCWVCGFVSDVRARRRPGAANAAEFDSDASDGRSTSPMRTFLTCQEEAGSVNEIVWEPMVRLPCRRNNDLIDRVVSLAGAHRFHYIGVTRYPRRRWLGGCRIKGHVHNDFPRWAAMHIIAFLAQGVGALENYAVDFVQQKSTLYRRNFNRCAGGGRFRAEAPGALYVLVASPL